MPESGHRVLAVRFDVDSVTCLERGIPPLLELGRRLGVRFTFFVNMGRSFSFREMVRARAGSSSSGAVPKLGTGRKLGWKGLCTTVVRNPRLGREYRTALDPLHAEGHELGLHGGTNHATWQRSLARLDDAELEALYRPAFDEFTERWGSPEGFASPGFQHDVRVLELLDREGFVYASDMPGDAPFRPVRPDGRRYRHYQVPVNVIGDGTVPLIEQGLARRLAPERIVRDAVERIREHSFALIYDHPFVAGVHSGLLERILDRVSGDYDIVPMNEYIRRWKERDESRT